MVVSGPTDLDRFQARVLAPVAVEDEVERAQNGLSPLPSRVLANHGEVTEGRLFDELRDGCDILYLVCHGYLAGDEPYLILENEDGTAARIRGGTLVDRIRDLIKVPRLVVLASCQSAGLGGDARSNDAGVLAALGPRLAEAGVPAVLAMQGDISMETVSRFMPTFFHELQRDGQIDRAMAAARGAIRDRHDWWAPALFMRLRSGRIWYVSGLGRAGEPFDKFPALVHEITNHKCTPILGPGLSDQLLGSRQENAQRWAKNFHFPMAPHSRDDLPQVAQYLSVSQSYEFPRDELGRTSGMRSSRVTATSCPRTTTGTERSKTSAEQALVRRVADPLSGGFVGPLRGAREASAAAVRDHAAREPVGGGIAGRGQGPPGRAMPLEAAGR